MNLRLAISFGLAIFLMTFTLPVRGFENLIYCEKPSFLSDDSAFEVEHVTTIDNEPSDEKDSSGDGEVPQEDSPESNDSTPQIETDGLNEQRVEIQSNTDSDIDSEGIPEQELQEETPVEEPVQEVTSPQAVEPVRLKAPAVPKERSLEEEAALKKVVHELKYGSLLNSIKLLQNMVSSYPYDPDYKSLLSAAQNLREADVWYQYQRRLQLPPPSAEPKVIYKLIKMERKEKPINELKRASWFNLIKNRARLQTR